MPRYEQSIEMVSIEAIVLCRRKVMSESDEVADSQTLAYEEAANLHAQKPDHELLRYVLRPDDDAVREEFVKRFGRPDLDQEANQAPSATAYMYVKYFLALHEANKDPMKEIVVIHGSPDSEYEIR
jgi:hypothetical protein